MSKGKSSISKVKSYREIGDFWDEHDISDYWGQTKAADFGVKIEFEMTYYALEKTLSEQVRSAARRRGVTADTLINLWVQEKLQEQEK